MHRINKPDSPVYYQFDMWTSAPLKHGVFTRLGGVSQAPWESLNVGSTVGDDLAAVAENARRLYQTLALDPKRVCSVWQVHSTDTIEVDYPRSDQAWIAKADGMITNTAGTVLVMRFADCVPVLFYDPVHHAIGMAHAGWRGTVQGAALSTLNAMTEHYGTDPTEVQAALGPSIGPSAYQVGNEVVEAVQTYFGTTAGFIQHADDGSAYLNLWEANRYTLAQAGVKHIEIAGMCTATHTDEFFSHRAEQGKTGRFGVVMALTEK